MVRELAGAGGYPADELDLMAALVKAVAWARYWQAPDDGDGPLSDDLAGLELEPPVWWSAGIDPDHQVLVSWDDWPAPRLEGATAALATWVATEHEAERQAARRPVDLEASYGGHWWSTPALSGLPTTSRPLPGLGAAQLRLVERFPLEVSLSRRHDWWRCAGARGFLLMPDWAAISRAYDAVHVSVLGYLTTAGVALPIADGTTVLAGWDPDQTWWLADVLETAGPSTTWTCSGAVWSPHASDGRVLKTGQAGSP